MMTPELLSQLDLVPVRLGSYDYLVLIPDENLIGAIENDPHYINVFDAVILAPGCGRFTSFEELEMTASKLLKTVPCSELILVAPPGVNRKPIVEIARRLGSGLGFPIEGTLKIRHNIQRENSVNIIDMASVDALPVNWLWRHRIALGKVTVIAGQPGLGKSQIAAAIAATVSTGGTWPCSEESAAVGNVVLITAEDELADTVKPRLIAAGADYNRIHVLDNKVVDSQNGKIGMLDINTHISEIEGLINNDLGGANLLVIDPISAYLGGTDQNSNGDIRAVMFRLTDLAQRLRIAVIIISHLNKKAGTDAMSRVIGSGGLVAAARALYMVSKKPDDPDGNRLFLVAKNNIGIDKGGFEYSIQSHTIDGGIETSRISWESVSDADADDVMSSRVGSAGKLTEAKELIQSEMNEREKMPAARMIELAGAAGISKSALNRARKELGIDSKKEGDLWYWHRAKVH